MAWYGDESLTVTVSQLGSVSQFNVLLIASPERKTETNRQTDKKINQKAAKNSWYLIFSSIIFALYITAEA